MMSFEPAMLGAAEGASVGAGVAGAAVAGAAVTGAEACSVGTAVGAGDAAVEQAATSSAAAAIPAIRVAARRRWPIPRSFIFSSSLLTVSLVVGSMIDRHLGLRAGYSLGMKRSSEPAPVRLRVGQAAEMLGVSVETLRRWESDGRLRMERSEGGQRLVSLEEVTSLLRERRRESVDRPIVAQSARNRFSGIVSRIDRDAIVAVVEVIAGPHRLVSLMTAEAVDDMGIEVGSEVVCAVKATNVVVEVPAGTTSRAADETGPEPGGTRAQGR